MFGVVVHGVARTIPSRSGKKNDPLEAGPCDPPSGQKQTVCWTPGRGLWPESDNRDIR